MKKKTAKKSRCNICGRTFGTMQGMRVHRHRAHRYPGIKKT